LQACLVKCSTYSKPCMEVFGTKFGKEVELDLSAMYKHTKHRGTWTTTTPKMSMTSKEMIWLTYRLKKSCGGFNVDEADEWQRCRKKGLEAMSMP
jgi:hypothetical protein